MNKDYLKLIMDEVRNFKEIKRQWRYMDLDDLVAHYIEEGIISSRSELIEVSTALEKKLGIMLNKNTFNDWWGDRGR